MYCNGLSENICFTYNYGRYQDGDGCTVLVFQKAFAPLINMEAFKMDTDICSSLSESICYSCKYGSFQDGYGYM